MPWRLASVTCIRRDDTDQRFVADVADVADVAISNVKVVLLSELRMVDGQRQIRRRGG